MTDRGLWWSMAMALQIAAATPREKKGGPRRLSPRIGVQASNHRPAQPVRPHRRTFDAANLLWVLVLFSLHVR